MREMNILQEADLPYFEELEKEGKAVILRFENLDELLDLDIEKYLGQQEQPIDAEALQKWILEQKELLEKEAKQTETVQTQISDMETRRSLLMKIRECQLPAEDKEIVMQALEEDFDDEVVLELLKPELTHEQRQLKYQKYQEHKKQD